MNRQPPFRAECTARIGLFPGTFDPIHLGHLAAARAFADALGLERVLFAPAKAVFHKAAPALGYEARLALCRRAAEAADPRFGVCELEREAPGGLLTVELLEALRERVPEGTSIHLLLGADVLLTLPHWRGAARIAELAEVDALLRGPQGFARAAVLCAELPYGRRIRLLRAETPAVSSTQIRRLAAAGDPVDDFVAPQTAAFFAELRAKAAAAPAREAPLI